MRKLNFIIFFFSFGMIAHADGGFSFFAGKYYFVVDYGLVFDENKTIIHQYLHEEYLKGTKIFNLTYDKVQRFELQTINRSKDVDAYIADLYWSPDSNYIAASIGEKTLILTPQFEIIRAYSNSYFTDWISSGEIRVISEDGSGGSVYGTSDYVIDVAENKAAKELTDLFENSY